MADYSSRFPSAAAPETRYYDESITDAKKQVINDAIKLRDRINPRCQKVKQNKKNDDRGRKIIFLLKA